MSWFIFLNHLIWIGLQWSVCLIQTLGKNTVHKERSLLWRHFTAGLILLSICEVSIYKMSCSWYVLVLVLAAVHLELWYFNLQFLCGRLKHLLSTGVSSGAIVAHDEVIVSFLQLSLAVFPFCKDSDIINLNVHIFICRDRVNNYIDIWHWHF